MLDECDLDHNDHLEKKEMELSKGYIFGTKLTISAIEGVARTTHDMLHLNKIFGGEHQINNHDDGFIIRDAKRKIAAAIGIDESISNNALKILFGPEDLKMSLLSEEEKKYEHDNKLLEDMSLREYNAFLVNNRDRLIDVFSRVSENEIGEIQETKTTITDWFIPTYQYYKKHKKSTATKILGKNVFAEYGNDILVSPNRYVTEITFEKWCEAYDNVEWIYKNGDKGDDYFSIVYRKAFRRNNFYPDYIIKTINGDIWIIEAKGGMSADGTSNNVDKYAGKKFDALKEYAKCHNNIKWGFIRAIGEQLYLSNTNWTEDMTNRNIWKPIEVFI